jgi:hypothetical protein
MRTASRPYDRGVRRTQYVLSASVRAGGAKESG